MNMVLHPLDEPALMRRVFALVQSGSEESPPVRTVLNAMDAGAASAIKAGLASMPSGAEGGTG
jgi:hypothetical protein